MTTIIAEGFSFAATRYIGGKYVDFKSMRLHYFKVFVGCIAIGIVGSIIHTLSIALYGQIILIVFLSAGAYLVIEIALKNYTIIRFVEELKRKIKI